MNDYYDGVRIIRDKNSKEAIGIEWLFNDGIISRYYPESTKEKWFTDFIDDCRINQNAMRKNRYHCLSLEAFEYEGEYFASYDTPDNFINAEEEQNVMDTFLNLLTETERKYLDYKLNNVDISLREIARQTNRSQTAIHKTFVRIRKKYLLFANSQNPKIFNMQ